MKTRSDNQDFADLRKELEFMEGINRLIGSEEESHYTLFVIVKDESTVQTCLEKVEAIVGDLNEPDTGVLASWPLSYVKGVPDKSGE